MFVVLVLVVRMEAGVCLDGGGKGQMCGVHR